MYTISFALRFYLITLLSMPNRGGWTTRLFSGRISSLLPNLICALTTSLLNARYTRWPNIIGDIRFCIFFFLAIRKRAVSIQTNRMQFYDIFPTIYDRLASKQCFYVRKCQHIRCFITLQIESVRSRAKSNRSSRDISLTPFRTNIARGTDKRDHYSKPVCKQYSCFFENKSSP